MRTRIASATAVIVVITLGVLLPGCSSDDGGGQDCNATGTGTLNIVNNSAITTYTVELDGAVLGTIPDGDRITRVLAAGNHLVRFLNPNGSEACVNPVTLAVCQITSTTCNTDPLPCQQQQFGEWTFVNGSGSVNYEVEVDGVIVDVVFAGDQSNPIQLDAGPHDVVFRNATTGAISCQEDIDVAVCADGQSSCAAP